MSGIGLTIFIFQLTYCLAKTLPEKSLSDLLVDTRPGINLT